MGDEVMTRDARRSLEEFTRSLQRPDEGREALAGTGASPVARSFGRAETSTKAKAKAKPEGLPKGLVIGLEAAAVLVVIAGVVLGPAFYTCQRMRDEGLFYYGTTVRSCMRERVIERTSSAEGFLRSLTGAR
jgi:hypothetical protein